MFAYTIRTAMLVILPLLFVGGIAEAHVPVLVEQKNLDNITIVSDPDISHAYYGALESFPHTYEIRATEPFVLYTQILVPDIEGQKNNISGIVIKVPTEGGRVEEVARLHAKDAGWESLFEFFGGDTYRHGPSFEKELGPGVYRVEVHTPDNLEKYVLVIGKTEDMTIGYLELIRRLAGVKEFFGKSQILVVQSPFVYIPLIVILCVGGGVWYVRKRRKGA